MTEKYLARIAFLAAAMVVFSFAFKECTTKRDKPDSNFKGVQVGAITYSWRSMPGTPKDIINYCTQNGISSIELMGNVAEEYAGAPVVPRRPKNLKELPKEEMDAFVLEEEAALKALSEWRISVAPAEKYQELREMFDDAGIGIHIVKFSPGSLE